MIVAQLINELKTMDQGVEVLVDLGDGLAEITGLDRGLAKPVEGGEDEWCYVIETTESGARESEDNQARLEKMGHRFGDG